MSTNLVPARSVGLGREQRGVSRALRQAQTPGRLAAAKIESAALAAHVALHHTAMLSATEGRLLQTAPLGEARYRAIVDAYAGYCCHEIGQLAVRDGLV